MCLLVAAAAVSKLWISTPFEIKQKLLLVIDSFLPPVSLLQKFRDSVVKEIFRELSKRDQLSAG